MLTNRRLLNMQEKVDLIQKMVSLPAITLSAEEADRFIECVWDRSVMKNHARLVKMDHQTKNVRAIGLGTSRILKPAATFTQSDYVKEFEENRIQLSSKELRACVVIYDKDLEDINVGTPQAFKNTVMSMVQKKMAEELDEIYWIADNHSLSGFANTDARSVMDGWRYQLDHSQSGEDYENDVVGSCVLLDASNTIGARAGSFSLTTSQAIAEQNASAPYNWEFKWVDMLKYLPSQYKLGGLKKLRFFLNDQVLDNYIEALMDRSTPLGDSVLTGKEMLHFGMVPVVPCPLMPTTMKIDTVDAQKEALKSDGTLTDCLLTHEENLIIGVQKDIQMEGERSAADRANYFFFTIRADVAIEDVHACVLLKRLKVV